LVIFSAMRSSGENYRAHDVIPRPTLGGLLYAKGTASASEQEWVALVRSIGAGDQRALQELYQRTYRIVFTLALRIAHSRETAEEVTLDVFYDVWKRAATYDPAGGTVVGWIMNQTRSRAIDRLRFEQRKKRSGHPEASASVIPLGDDPQEMASAHELTRLLRDAVRLLTPEERQAIEATFFSGLTHVQVAAQLEIPLGTVKTRVRAGLGKLRQALRARRDEL